tara:strand:- start:75 stop:335 length:261 start_codon:yes stop_codon:yes gene_type:complete
MGFDRANYSYDTVVLSQPQSGGTRLQLEAAVGSHNNELIRAYVSDSAFARIGKSVVRLDVMTPSLISPLCHSGPLKTHRGWGMGLG